jgi:hypothetical protein
MSIKNIQSLLRFFQTTAIRMTYLLSSLMLGILTLISMSTVSAQASPIEIGVLADFPPPPIDATGESRFVLTPTNPKLGEPFYVQIAGPRAGVDGINCRRLQGTIVAREVPPRVIFGCDGIIGGAPPFTPTTVTMRVNTPLQFNLDFLNLDNTIFFQRRVIIGVSVFDAPAGSPLTWVLLFLLLTTFTAVFAKRIKLKYRGGGYLVFSSFPFLLVY